MTIKDILTLSMIKGIGPAFIKQHIDRIQSDIECDTIIKEYKNNELNNISKYKLVADQILIDCERNDIEAIAINSQEYPKKLLQISDPPSILYLKGNKKLLSKALAIIGTRHSSNLGNTIAERLGQYFSKEYAICNGLVEGIDEHSIYSSDGEILPNVIGIISGGLIYDETCSKNHAKTIEKVLSSGGLIISEYPPQYKEDQYSGSKASRIQAGLSDGLILVQSKIDGGSKYTMKCFSKLGRDIGVIHFPSSEEYNTESFSANRLIIEKKEKGIAEFIGLTSTKSLSIKSITPISCKEDYNTFSQKLMTSQHSLFND